MVVDEWYAGIDAGGTATKVWLYHRGDGRVGRGIGPAGNVLAVGTEGVARAVLVALERAADSAEVGGIPSVRVLSACVAGARRQEERQAIKERLEVAFANTTVIVAPDVAAGLAAGTLGEPGVVVIAGTGSTAWGLTAEKTWVRKGGWGYLLGDEGSGFYFGLAALKAVVRAVDGLGKPTALIDAVEAELAIKDLSELIPLVYGPKVPKERIASLAPVVIECARKDDPVARSIVSEGVKELVQLAVSAVDATKLDGTTPVVVVGGLFNVPDILSRFEVEVRRQRRVRVVRPQVEPAAGACLLALRAGAAWSDDEWEAFLRSHARLKS